MGQSFEDKERAGNAKAIPALFCYTTGMKTVSKSRAETREAADYFLQNLMPGKQATVVALQGDLGAGKTAFTQEVGKIVGVGENMASPTFVIMKIYAIDFRGFHKLIHIDAYRLEGENELVNLGWEEMMQEPTNLIFVEWPERVAGLIPEEAKKISLAFVDEVTRHIHIHESETK